MKKRLIIIIVILTSIILLASFIFNNFISKEALVGKYINKNYNYQPFIPDIPYVADTLIIKNTGNFRSSYFGNGKITLAYSISGTKVNFIYTYKIGKAILRRNVYRTFFSSPKIILYKEENHYYKKIE